MTTKQDVQSLPLEQAWEIFKKEASETDAAYRAVRFGVKIKFDLYDYLKGFIQPTSKSITRINEKMYSNSDFWTELELREKVMFDWLAENYVDTEIATPRGRRSA